MPSPLQTRVRNAALPLIVFFAAASTYVAFLGERRFEPSPDNHYVHLAASWLDGQLSVLGNEPPGTNDWACYDTVERGPCPANVFRFPANAGARYRWYVSFPPFPAVLLVPAVAAFGADLPDRFFWAVLAGLGPALLFVLLRRLRREGRSGRSIREDLLLTALFAFGTVYFFTAVQGTVWFAAHVVATSLIALYVLFALDARRPVWAGAMLGLAFMTRPTTLLLGAFFVAEVLRMSRAPEAPRGSDDDPWWRKLVAWLADVRWSAALPRLALFALPVLAIGLVAMQLNEARFDDPFEFGHRYLQIRWRPRIERWGLFSYHYLPRNLAIFTASLPWLTALPPYLTISRHGLALWVTTPNLLLALWPKRVDALAIGLWVAVIPVVLLNLMYQNSGWVQFGYRFALDYLVLVFVLLALSRRRFGIGFVALAVFSVAVNTFGALTFDRDWKYYDADPTQNVLFQPD